MEQTINQRPSRTRKPPAGLSAYDTAREDSAEPQSRPPAPASTPSPAKGGRGEQIRSPKRRKVVDTAVPSNSPPASSTPEARDLGENEAEAVEEDNEVEEAQEEQDSMREDESGAAEPSAIMQLPQELLARILGALPSNYLIQASGVCFPSSSL